MIWHIFKKDFRLLWRFAAVVAVLEFLAVSVLYQADHGGFDGRRTSALLNVLVVLQLIGSAALAAAAVHSDAVPGVRQDWLVRPIPRRDLLSAKVLFVVLVVQGADVDRRHRGRNGERRPVRRDDRCDDHPGSLHAGCAVPPGFGLRFPHQQPYREHRRHRDRGCRVFALLDSR